jgi:protein SCO1/2
MRFLLLFVVIISSHLTLYSNESPFEFKNVGIENKIESTVTQDIYLRDEYDKIINLKDVINDKPTIINFVYLNCPLLCHLLLDGLTEVMVKSDYKIAKDYQVLTISIDPKESNENLKAYKRKYHHQLKINNGWLFLKGSETEIKKITKNFGFNYKYIERTSDYSHPSAIFFYNNKITNYLEGVTFDKKTFDYSIMRSKPEKNFKEKVITYCYYFDPDNQTYSFMIFKILRLLCLITVCILSIIIIQMLRKERHNKHE